MWEPLFVVLSLRLVGFAQLVCIFMLSVFTRLAPEFHICLLLLYFRSAVITR